MENEVKIGVYICECGINIAATVDVERVVEYAKTLPNVAVSRFYKYMCSDPGQTLIKNDIKELGLNRIVVASCSPRMHEPTFRAVLEEAGLNQYCFEMANIREQCSWVHKDREKATKKAMEIIAGSVARASILEPIEIMEVPVTQSALVIGGGIAGIQAALDIADMGYKTYLVESEPSIGGRMAQLDKTFPTLDCSACILTPKMVDVARHKNIDLITYAEVTNVDGYVGNFKVTVRKKPRYVDEEKCTGCGECAQSCPVIIPNQFDMNLGSRRAIYVPFPQAVPLKYTVDKREGLPPCRATCPAGINGQGYVALTAAGKFKEALDIVKEKTPFPGVLGRICHHPCETECNRRDLDEAVAICELKRFLADYALEHGTEETPEIAEKKNEKVAIIGSGPGGLTAANNLARMGYQVTVFEALPIAGGMLAVGIPDYRLPRDILNHEIDAIKALGVEIKTSTPIGKDLTIQNLFDQGYKAIFIATGAHKSMKLGIEGENLVGVYHGVDFLRDVALDKTPKIGKKVAVIGGGNVAIDSVRTAARLGSEAFIVYRRSREEMPAYAWEVEEADEEGIKIHFLATPLRILGKNGKVIGVECIKMELGKPDESGRRRPVPIEGSEFTIDVDTVIPAIGQFPDNSFMTDDTKFNLTKWNTFMVDRNSLMTNIEGVFAGGDNVSGPASAIEAIAHGNKAAEAIDRYIKGQSPIGIGETIEEIVTYDDIELDLSEFEKIPRQKPSLLPAAERVKNFKEVVSKTFTEEEAKAEANRCLNCTICCSCGECLKACKELQAIDHNMKEEFIDLDVGAIVIATGFDLFDAAEKPEYGYSKFDNVITGLEFERLVSASGPTAGHIQINGKDPKNVVFIQCVGSRDREGNEYCSRVCCMYTAKQAHLVREKLPGAETTIFYTDVRAFGKGFEEFYVRVQDEGVKYLRRELDDKIEVVEGNDGKVIVKAANHPDIEADLVVLATGIVPRDNVKEVVRRFRISQSADGFLFEAHPKLQPLDSFTCGIFLAGCCQGPKDIPDTVAQASGAAARACTIISNEKLSVSGEIAHVDTDKCVACLTCVRVCPYNVPNINPEGVAEIEGAKCQGCGTCAGECPVKAIELKHYLDEQVIAKCDAIIEAST